MPVVMVVDMGQTVATVVLVEDWVMLVLHREQGLKVVMVVP
jgi:hypothetical protein